MCKERSLSFHHRNSASSVTSIDSAGRWLTLAITVLLFVTLCNSASMAKQNDHVDVLRGVLQSVRTFGPPGYGETPKKDSRVRYLVLKSEQPVFIPCGPNDLPKGSSDCPSTLRLKLLFDIGIDPTSEARAARFVGKQVKVTGHLERWSTAADYTPIVMWVDSIEVSTVVGAK